MNDQSHFIGNLSDFEFDEWLKNQLQASMPEPPANFTDVVMERIETVPVKEPADPIILITIVAIILIGTFILVLLSLSTTAWLSNIAKHLTLNSWPSSVSIVRIVSISVLLGLAFFGFDGWLKKTLKKKKLSLT